MSTVKRPPDPWYKATLSVALHGARLQFHVAQDLFSSASLDPGTAALLRTLAGAEYSRVLDLGCGYGPLGLFLKAWRPDATVDCVDRDGLAVAYAAMNAELNGLAIDAYASLGYDDIPPDDAGFDLIVSNIPAKAGPAVIEALVLDAGAFLRDGGRVALVAIDRIAGDVRRVIPEPELEWSNRGYTVFHYRPGARDYRNAFDRGVYDRGRLRYKDAEIRTVWGLPEFDTPSYGTQLALRLLPRLRGGVHIVNPGQGLLAAAAKGSVSVDHRDLLATRTTSRNAEIIDNVDADTVVVMIREHEPLAATLAALGDMQRALIAGTSTQVTRVIEATGADVVAREKTRGFSAALLGLSD